MRKNFLRTSVLALALTLPMAALAAGVATGMDGNGSPAGTPNALGNDNAAANNSNGANDGNGSKNVNDCNNMKHPTADSGCAGTTK